MLMYSLRWTRIDATEIKSTQLSDAVHEKQRNFQKKNPVRFLLDVF